LVVIIVSLKPEGARAFAPAEPAAGRAMRAVRAEEPAADRAALEPGILLGIAAADAHSLVRGRHLKTTRAAKYPAARGV
jgi:hypothetical protein